MRIPSSAVIELLKGLGLPDVERDDASDRSLIQDLIDCCQSETGRRDPAFVWSDWKLLASGNQLFARAFRRLAAKTQERADAKAANECVLVACNTEAPGPYAATALQSHLGWPSVWIVTPIAGIWMLHPKPAWNTKRKIRALDVVLCDGVRDTGAHLNESFFYLKSKVPELRVVCVSVVYDNRPDGQDFIDFDYGNRGVPVVSLVSRGVESCVPDNKRYDVGSPQFL